MGIKSSRSKSKISTSNFYFNLPATLPATLKNKNMAAQDSAAGTTPAERHAIGISFGNSNSSIALTSVDDKAEVIANEDGGK